MRFFHTPSTTKKSPFAGQTHRRRGIAALIGGAILLAAFAMSTGAGAVGGPPAANLDQCKNGSTGTEACIGSNWVNGNLGASNSKYFEGDSIPYRIGLTNLDAGTHTVTIQWDTTKSGKHAIDYLTTWDRTANAGSNACDGYTCGAGTTTLAIPADPNVTGGGVTPIAGNFTLFGGTLSSVGGYTLSAPYTGDSSTSITISFSVPGNADAVLAWGGHIATRSDWGTTSSAVDIPGSPYHSRLLDLDGSGGNQDRSLSAEAVIFPASITLIKDAIPNGATSFSFTDTGGLTPTSFSLVDDGTSANTQAFTNIQTFTTYTFTEGAATGWTLSFGNPVCTVTSADGGTQSADTGTRTLTITLAEGEDVTCTFTNTQSQKASPTISTTPSAGGVIGTVLNDTATLSGGSSPTGSVTFKLFPPSDATCAGTAAYTFTDATAPYATTPGFTSDAAGTWHWTADYAGDANNNPASSGCAAEPVVITKISSSTATTIHDANHGTVTSVPAGTTVHDSATVSGSGPTPTGTVDFTWFTNGTCTGSGTASGTGIALVAGVADPSTSQTPATAGSYAFQATYSGDSVYDGSTGPCEPLTVTKISSSTATTIHDANHGTVTSVPAGTTVHDSATVSGSGPTPTGTVDFTWFTNGTCTGSGTGSGTGIALVAGVADPSTSQTPATAGSYAFQATYSGDSVYDGSTGPCEPLTVTKISSSTATTIHDANHGTVTSVPAGSTVHDSATVSGSGPTPTGTVGFTWFTNGTCTGSGTASGTGIALVAGVADPSTSQTPATAGSYAFQATYSGDSVYDGSTGPCEPLTVTKISSSTATTIHDTDHNPVTSVAVGTTVHDSATVSGAGPTPTGTVSFTWFNEGRCDSEGTSAGSITLVGGVAHPSTSQTPSTPGMYSFQATYSGDNVYDGSTGDCEPLTVTEASSSTATTIHDANHNAVTSVLAGTTVHDSASVSATAGGTPTGTVTFQWFTNGSCTGTAAATSSAFTLVSGTVDGTTFTQTPNSAGSYSFQAVYSGDTNHTGSTGPCEPLTVTQLPPPPPPPPPPAGAVTVIKHVVNSNGGTKTAADFNIHVKSSNGSDVANSPQAGSETGTAYVLLAGTYTVSEDAVPEGYVQTSITCDGVATATITVASAGDTHTCTITNSDLPASLTVIKHVVNASGNAVASDFTMTVTGGSPSPASFPGSETGTLVTLSAGTYSVSETTRIGYTATFSADCSGTIAIGQSKTCTITNTQSAPPAGTLTVIKHVITTTGATKTAADFTVHVKLNGTDVTGSPQAGSETGTAYTLNPGTYTVSEDTPPAGYVQVSITCDGAASATVTIASAGDTHTCTITNQAVPAPQPPNTGNSGHIATTLSIWWVLLAVLGSLALTGSGTAVLVRRARRA